VKEGWRGGDCIGRDGGGGVAERGGKRWRRCARAVEMRKTKRVGDPEERSGKEKHRGTKRDGDKARRGGAEGYHVRKDDEGMTGCGKRGGGGGGGGGRGRGKER